MIPSVEENSLVSMKKRLHVTMAALPLDASGGPWRLQITFPDGNELVSGWNYSGIIGGAEGDRTLDLMTAS